VNEAIRQKAAYNGPAEATVEIETQTIVDDISREVIEALGDSFKRLLSPTDPS
jgi:hypothetical protein